MRCWSLCTFWNELDVLEIRLREQRDRVGVFVVSEAPWTYAGTPKPLVLSESLRSDPTRWADALGPAELRIVVVDDPPPDTRPYQPFGDPARWQRENHQRRSLARGLEGLEPDDVVMLSDCDEIVRPIAFDAYQAAERRGISRPHLPMHVGSASLRWPFPRALGVIARFCRGRTLLEASTFWTGVPTGLDPEQLRQWPVADEWPLGNAQTYAASDAGAWGWHLSYLGGPDAMVQKLVEAAHPEMNEPRFLDADWMRGCLATGRDLFDRRTRRCAWIPPDALPRSLVDDERMSAAHTMPCPEGWYRQRHGGFEPRRR